MAKRPKPLRWVWDGLCPPDIFLFFMLNWCILGQLFQVQVVACLDVVECCRYMNTLMMDLTSSHTTMHGMQKNEAWLNDYNKKTEFSNVIMVNNKSKKDTD